MANLDSILESLTRTYPTKTQQALNENSELVELLAIIEKAEKAKKGKKNQKLVLGSIYDQMPEGLSEDMAAEFADRVLGIRSRGPRRPHHSVKDLLRQAVAAFSDPTGNVLIDE